jgi:DNA gyrase subunit A
MSVIVSRALPDVRDGLKPVHRRILYAARQGHCRGQALSQVGAIVGDVMGKYHPHGDSAIYDALARMAQDWSMRVPLIDGQGNFGSMDPTARRRCAIPRRVWQGRQRPARRSRQGHGRFPDNYDGSEQEPHRAPARFPNLLVNGAGGIAVGMATNIPPHNLGEVIDACLADDRQSAISLEELIEIIPGPDFPTGALILGQSGARSAYGTGRGSIIMRCAPHHRGRARRPPLDRAHRNPFQVGKNGLVEKIAEAAKDKRIEGISDIRDESSREGVRVVIDLKRDATPDVVLNQLWRHTPAQSSFPANMLAIRGGGRNAEPARHYRRVHPVPRGGHHPPHQVRAEQGARPGAYVARPRHRRHQPRRGRADHPGVVDPAEAREKLLAREWPIGEIAPYIRLSRRSRPRSEGGTYRLSERRSARSSTCACTASPRWAATRSATSCKQLAAAIEEYLAILADRVKLYAVMREELSRCASSPRRASPKSPPRPTASTTKT